MKNATVKYIANFDAPESWKIIDENRINNINWSEYSYHPKVSFKLAHNGDMLFIHYNVIENYPIRTLNTKDQDPVYHDSCVEFFILDDEKYYHNFEFNSAGIALSAKGKDRSNRISRTESEMQKIIRLPSGIKEEDNKFHWSLTIGIPFASVGMVRGRSYRANLYKCGNLTPKEHYLSWNKIDTKTPNFHLPAYFGEIVIE